MNFDLHGARSRAMLEASGVEVNLAPKAGARTPAEVASLVRDCVAAVVSTDPFDADVFSRAPSLRVIARMGVGTDSVDLSAATRAGVAVTTTPGANTATTADHTLALLLSLIRRIVENDQAVRAGHWNRADDLTPWELSGKTIGLIGFGGIGQAVARRLSGFDVTLLAVDPRGVDSAGDSVRECSLRDVLSRSHVVSVHAPLNDQTRGMIGRRELASMRSDAILINTSRGGLVDQQALIDALQAGHLRGAGLDVFEDEPLGESPLRSMQQVALSPHIAGLSDRSIGEMIDRATLQVLRVLSGRHEPDIVNPEALAHRKFRHPVIPRDLATEVAIDSEGLGM